MASKTREKLIDVAKQLFIKKGIDNTTISDIANASDKGRRTIYTYFKDKREIYDAVIERESDKMVSEMRAIANSDASAADKLRQFLDLRISQTHNTVSLYSLIKSFLKMDFRRVEKAKKMAYEKQESIIIEILDEGVRNGDFHPARTAQLKGFICHLLDTIDVASADAPAPITDAHSATALIDYIVGTLTQ